MPMPMPMPMKVTVGLTDGIKGTLGLQ